MDDHYKFLTSTEWWISVVIAGIAINVLSAYLKASLDGRLSSLSSWWRLRSEREKEKERAYVERLKQEGRFFALNQIRILNSIRWSILWLLIGFMGFLSTTFALGDNASVTIMGLSSIAFIRGFQHTWKIGKLVLLAEEAVVGSDT